MSPEFWFLILVWLFLLLVGFPWLVKHPIDLHHHQGAGATFRP
jgi:hypothetical protein